MKMTKRPHENPTLVVVTFNCVCCNKAVDVVVPIAGLALFMSGVSIQKALPYVSVDDREMFLSGICSDCFPKEEEEEFYDEEQPDPEPETDEDLDICCN